MDMPATNYQTESILLKSHFLPGDVAELRLLCDSVTLTDRGLGVEGVETRHIERMVRTADDLSFEQDGQHHRILRRASARRLPPKDDCALHSSAYHEPAIFPGCTFALAHH